MTSLFFTGSSLDPWVERPKPCTYVEVRVIDLLRRIKSPFRPIFEGLKRIPLKDVSMHFRTLNSKHFFLINSITGCPGARGLAAPHPVLIHDDHDLNS